MFLDPATDAPKWRKGNIVTMAMVLLTVLVSEGVRLLDRPGRAQRLKELEIVAHQDAQLGAEEHDIQETKDNQEDTNTTEVEKAAATKWASDSKG